MLFYGLFESKAVVIHINISIVNNTIMIIIIWCNIDIVVILNFVNIIIRIQNRCIFYIFLFPIYFLIVFFIFIEIQLITCCLTVISSY